MNLETVRNKLEMVTNARPTLGLTNLVKVCDNLIPMIVKDGLLELVANENKSKDDLSHFFHGDQIYQIKVQEDLFDSTVLRIALIRLGIDKAKLHRESKIAIDSIGQFSTVHFCIPENAPIDLSEIEEVSMFIVESSYSWLLERFRKKLRETEKVFENSMWSLIRQIFKSNEQIISNIYLILVTEDQAINCVDIFKTESLLSKAKNVTHITNNGSARMVAEFIEAGVPFDLSFSKQAILHGQRIDLELSLAKYKERLTIFQKSQMAIYDTKVVSWQPLVKSQRNMLVAAYPKELSDVIEPEIIKNLTLFHDIVNNTKSNFIGAWHILNRKTNSDNSKMSEMLGGFTGGFVKAFMEGS